MMCDRQLCGLSVVFHCRRYWLLLYSLHFYCNNIQNHTPYYKFIARHHAVYIHAHTCMQMLLLLNCYFPIRIKYWEPGKLPWMPFPQLSPTKGSLCNCKISLPSYTGAYVNRQLTVYQQLHSAVFSNSYLFTLLAHYRAHWNYWRWLYNFRILYRLNSTWVVNCLYSTVPTVTVGVSASLCVVMG
jgi:hypothetical protein